MVLCVNDFELYDCVILDDNNEYILINEKGKKQWMLLENYDEYKCLEKLDNNIDSEIFVFNQPLKKKKRGRPKKCNDEIEENSEKKSRGRPRKSDHHNENENKKKPTKYNIFIKDKTKQLQEQYPNLDKKTRFKKILKMWNDNQKN